MTSAETITLTRAEYDALVARNDELEDRLAALEADDGSRIPHEVALAIMRGQGPYPRISGSPGSLHCASSPREQGSARVIFLRSSAGSNPAPRPPCLE